MDVFSVKLNPRLVCICIASCRCSQMRMVKRLFENVIDDSLAPMHPLMENDKQNMLFYSLSLMSKKIMRKKNTQFKLPAVYSIIDTLSPSIDWPSIFS